MRPQRPSACCRRLHSLSATSRDIYAALYALCLLQQLTLKLALQFAFSVRELHAVNLVNAAFNIAFLELEAHLLEHYAYSTATLSQALFSSERARARLRVLSALVLVCALQCSPFYSLCLRGTRSTHRRPRRSPTRSTSLAASLRVTTSSRRCLARLTRASRRRKNSCRSYILLARKYSKLVSIIL